MSTDRVSLKWEPAIGDYYCSACGYNANIEFAESQIGIRWLCVYCGNSGIMWDEFMKDYPILVIEQEDREKHTLTIGDCK